MIPNIIHFIVGLEEKFGNAPFSLIHFLAILSAKKVNNPEKIYFHYAYEPEGKWWEKAKPYFYILIRYEMNNSSVRHYLI